MDEIRDLSARVAELEEDLEEPKDDLKLTIKQGCAALGLVEPAFKTAHKLKRKLEPVKLAAWLKTFDQARKALNLDAQVAMDLEPPRRRGRKKADDTAALN
jgi:hypothetical protein